MKLLVTAQQSRHFSQLGFVEFEEALSLSLLSTLAPLLSAHPPGSVDLWMEHPPLKKMLASPPFSTLALSLVRKPLLQLATDEWIGSEGAQRKPGKLSARLSIGAPACALLLRLPGGGPEEPLSSTYQDEPGLLPLPRLPGNLIACKPHLLVNWPALAHFPPTPLYLAFYALPHSARYLDNPQDPARLRLKKLGYGFGDLLRPDTHPLIRDAQ